VKIGEVKLANSLVEEQLNRLPNSPGVYLLRDAEGNILYVGKAANLRHRVRSYFGAGQKLSPKLLKMVARVADIDFYVTSLEQEALILELNLIKRHHPRYNVQLKDDKTFPYLKINSKEDWPRVYVTRRVEQDGAR
jgi:excinuclease ABC subunit C